MVNGTGEFMDFLLGALVMLASVIVVFALLILFGLYRVGRRQIEFQKQQASQPQLAKSEDDEKMRENIVVLVKRDPQLVKNPGDT